MIERLNYLVEIDIFQDNQENGVNSLYTISKGSSSSESSFISTFLGTPTIEDFFNIKLNDKWSSDPAENDSFISDN